MSLDTRQTVATEGGDPPFVTNRPSCIRRQAPQDPLYDFETFKHRLPVVEPMLQGYCHSSVLNPTGLPGVNVRVIWDGGAEGTSTSA